MNTARNNSSQWPESNQENGTAAIPPVVCIENNESVFDALVGKVVKEHIFPKKQFIILERELDENGKLADKCIKALQIERKKWYSVRNKIRRSLNRRRNNVQQSVRRSLQKYMETNGTESVNLEMVLQGRKNRESFHWFLDNIAGSIVGLSVAEEVKSVKLPSEWLSRSLEAFSYLCLENYFEMTRNQVENKMPTGTYQPLWTKDGRGKRKNQGWSQDGIRRYNELCEQVRVDRERFRMEDSIYLNAKVRVKQSMEMERLKKRQELNDKRDEGLQAAEDDFSDSGEE